MNTYDYMSNTLYNIGMYIYKFIIVNNKNSLRHLNIFHPIKYLNNNHSNAIGNIGKVEKHL